jgi:hypothetical protein
MSLLPLLRTRTSLEQPIGGGCRTMIEPLEERQFFSAAPAVAGLDLPLKTQSAVFANKIAKNGVNSILPLKITSVSVQDGQLVAVGQIGSHTFNIPLTLTTTPSGTEGVTSQATTDILHLQLGPIHLDLLGLKVDTSQICLDINAVSGPGNLLGNLLTSVANLLNGGTPLGTILGGLSGTQLNQLLGGLTDLLNGIFGAILSPANVTGASAAPTAAAVAAAPVNILHLALGPVDLNLLGLQVGLDNCANGPVTVDITAQPGPGNLLGNLLGSVAHLLDNPSNPTALANLLTRITTILDGLLG